MYKGFFILLVLFFPVFTVSGQEKESYKFEEINSLTNCEFERAVLDGFFIKLQDNLDYKGFIIYYEGKYLKGKYEDGKLVKTGSVLPRYGEANYRIRMIRDHIRLRKFDQESILFVNGGYREEFTVEFWLVPKSAELPIPTPSLNKIKYRNGKLPDEPMPCPG